MSKKYVAHFSSFMAMHRTEYHIQKSRGKLHTPQSCITDDFYTVSERVTEHSLTMPHQTQFRSFQLILQSQFFDWYRQT